MFDIDSFGDWAKYNEGCTYKVSVSDVKKSEKKNAACIIQSDDIRGLGAGKNTAAGRFEELLFRYGWFIKL